MRRYSSKTEFEVKRHQNLTPLATRRTDPWVVHFFVQTAVSRAEPVEFTKPALRLVRSR